MYIRFRTKERTSHGLKRKEWVKGGGGEGGEREEEEGGGRRKGERRKEGREEEAHHHIYSPPCPVRALMEYSLTRVIY